MPLDCAAAPPYDVLSESDVEQLAARHERNIVLVDVPRPEDDVDRYDRAASRLLEWEREKTLLRDDAPAFTIYRMAFRSEDGTPRETVGVVGALEVVDEGAGGVLPHERTTPKAKSDRLDLTRATRANLSPVWGLSLTSELTDLLREPGELMGICPDPDGVVHTVERVSEPARVAAIADAVSRNPVLIADGHHRYAIARTYRDERRATDGPGPWDLTLAYVSELVEDQLSIDAIHRLYCGIGADQLLDALGRSFDVADAGAVDESAASEMQRRGALYLVRSDGTGAWLRPRPDAFAGVRAIDGALLEHALRDVEVEVSYQHGIRNVLEVLAAGGADAAVLIRPTSIAEIRRTADEGVLMPPKSTFFTPKLRTGLVVRPLAD